MIEAETCSHLVTLNKINIHNTSCVLTCLASSSSIIYLRLDDGLVIEAETCSHLVTLNKINICNTGCVLTCDSLLLTWNNKLIYIVATCRLFLQSSKELA